MMLSSIPVVAIIPVLSRLFGYHMTTLIIIVAIICFLPAFVYMHAGLRSVPAAVWMSSACSGLARGHGCCCFDCQHPCHPV
ncbi:hypothetical protein A0U89_16805 (plasmid) [Kozakia baliensis]|uniref:Uncharacterized protein n=2 Tax=Kozakia baliensis TaxID=153496 RepID=A0A1D8UZH3_9PROT|nr:hypothetical protein A0U89_16805 [Kozakia baliensis]